MRSIIIRYIAPIQSIVTLLVALEIGLYINLLTTEMAENQANKSLIDAVGDLGAWNWLLPCAIALTVAQAPLADLPIRRMCSKRDEIIRLILAAASKSIIYPEPDSKKHIRAIVTLRHGNSGKRVTKYVYNAEPDPERVASYPIEFGITGEAYRTCSVVVKELPAQHHRNLDPELQDDILPAVRTVLAAPILKDDCEDESPLGVLAFDSIHPIRVIKFDKPEAREIAQRWADIISQLLIFSGN